jgi:hypothetical protein
MICPNKTLQFWGYAVSAGVLEIDGEDFLTICTFTNHSWENLSSIPRMKSPHSLGAESFTTRSNSLAAAKSSYGHMGWSTNLVSKQNNLLKRLGEFRRSYPNSEPLTHFRDHPWPSRALSACTFNSLQRHGLGTRAELWVL